MRRKFGVPGESQPLNAVCLRCSGWVNSLALWCFSDRFPLQINLQWTPCRASLGSPPRSAALWLIQPKAVAFDSLSTPLRLCIDAESTVALMVLDLKADWAVVCVWVCFSTVPDSLDLLIISPSISSGFGIHFFGYYLDMFSPIL